MWRARQADTAREAAVVVVNVDVDGAPLRCSGEPSMGRQADRQTDRRGGEGEREEGRE